MPGQINNRVLILSDIPSRSGRCSLSDYLKSGLIDNLWGSNKALSSNYCLIQLYGISLFVCHDLTEEEKVRETFFLCYMKCNIHYQFFYKNKNIFFLISCHQLSVNEFCGRKKFKHFNFIKNFNYICIYKNVTQNTNILQN